MNYIEISANDAMNALREIGMALVAIQDLEHEEEVLSFVKKTRTECNELIKDAQTIISQRDDFVREMDFFTQKQMDLKHICPVGKEIIILY